MTLADLLEGDGALVENWLREKELIHECDCGYTVYDRDDVNYAVQDEWGDDRCDEIHQWACDLANRFGWLFVEAARPEHDIYKCQYCAGSELSLLLERAPINLQQASSLVSRDVGLKARVEVNRREILG
jgi:hypothetical protein